VVQQLVLVGRQLVPLLLPLPQAVVVKISGEPSWFPAVFLVAPLAKQP
jgi:hypothetical protein